MEKSCLELPGILLFMMLEKYADLASESFLSYVHQYLR